MNMVLENSPRTPLSRANKMNASNAAASWLEVVSHLEPKYGGLSTAVPALGESVMRASGRAVSLAAFCAPAEHFIPAEAESMTVRHFPLRRRDWAREVGAAEHFEAMVTDAAGVHIHGLWQHSTERTARLAQTLGRPYIVSAHGMLERWALRQKRWKKAVYAALIERPLLRRATCLHALTEAEANDYRRFGLRNPVVVIPNGVTVRSDVGPEQFLAQFPELRKQRVLLFLGRLHAKKGLHVLCDAWRDIERRWPEARLVIAGPDYENTRQTLERRCAELGCKRVTFTGMLAGDLKWSALRAAEAFLLPSYSEGLSVSVLEAMGMDLPVIISKQCNLPEVERRTCGWTIDPERGALVSAMDECLRAPAAQRADMGKNGRELVRSRYSWERVGEQMAAVYGWMIGGPKPSDVFSGEPDASEAPARKVASA